VPALTATPARERVKPGQAALAQVCGEGDAQAALTHPAAAA
jgi:hypothetical protein